MKKRLFKTRSLQNFVSWYEKITNLKLHQETIKLISKKFII